MVIEKRIQWKNYKKANNKAPRTFQERTSWKTLEQKLMFNLMCYPVFQNFRNMFQELYQLLAPDKEHKKVFPDIPVVVFPNS